MREPVNATDDRKAKIKKWITENILRPKAAIVLLRNNSNVARSSSAIELYDIAEGGRLNNGRPISVESLDAFIQAAQMSLNKRKKAKTYISGVIDPSILYVSQTSIAFMYPSGIRSIFIGNEKDFKEFKLFVPAMVFVYETRKQLWAYWSKTEDRELLVNGERVLIPAPMPNIDHQGNVCIGTSMKKKMGHDIQFMRKYIVDSFFGSAFNEWREGHAAEAVKYCTKQMNQKTTNETFWKAAKKQQWNKAVNFITLHTAIQ